MLKTLDAANRENLPVGPSSTLPSNQDRELLEEMGYDEDDIQDRLSGSRAGGGWGGFRV